MKISDEISLSARNLLRRKGRTALTLVGVVIGTCMVVLMISLGIAQTKTNEEMLQSWGDLTQVQIYGYGTMMGSDGKPLYLDDAAIANIKQIPHVAAATPYAQAYNLEGEITAGRNGRYTSDIYNLIGIDPTALEPMGFALQSGSWPTNTPASEKATKLQVLVGSSTGYNFQDSRKSYNSPKRYRYEGQTDANGKELPPFVDIDKDKMTLTIKTGEGSTEKSRSWELEIVGVLEPDGAKGYWTQSGIVLRIQDMKMLQKIYNDMTKTKEESKSYDQVYVKVDDLSNVTDVETAIHDLGFTNTYSMNQQREEMQKQVMNSQMIFGGIAAVSLLVAAINIINTMTMAIYERTREIGVMKVLGCELGNIRTMFLLESSTIGFIGGLIGLGISLIASFVLNNLSTLGQGLDLSGLMGGGYYMGGGGGTISIIPPWLMLAALVFATLVGLVAGILPANKAVKISALEAIRHE
ncbi:ABC transporter permease [Gemmiger sp.]|uniref:ABC transporter permease n=1 Tax=Gemmiger sp. TaxID=2049027 RepID=UPI0027E15D8C|nr:ABC transporter permease [Gemmiger sp.]MBS6107893.1 ABC transporter permease [Subdoligranulum variabile]MEE0413223.1 ABC transporter permease [Gemmiger sp.]